MTQLELTRTSGTTTAKTSRRIKGKDGDGG